MLSATLLQIEDETIRLLIYSMSILLITKAVDSLIQDLEPTDDENECRKRVDNFITATLKGTFGADSFAIGSILSRNVLPNETLEITQILPRNQVEKWCIMSNKALNSEAEKNLNGVAVSGEIQLEIISYASIENYIATTINGLQYKISPNNVRSVFLAGLFEEMNLVIGSNNLLKRSFLFIKLWCTYESKRYWVKAVSELFNHDALSVMVLWLFASREPYQHPIDHPLRALIYFLEEFSTLDWDNYAVTVTHLHLLPNQYSNTSQSNDSTTSSIDTHVYGDQNLPIDSDLFSHPNSTTSYPNNIPNNNNPLRFAMHKAIKKYRTRYAASFGIDLPAVPEGSMSRPNVPGPMVPVVGTDTYSFSATASKSAYYQQSYANTNHNSSFNFPLLGSTPMRPTAGVFDNNLISSSTSSDNTELNSVSPLQSPSRINPFTNPNFFIIDPIASIQQYAIAPNMTMFHQHNLTTSGLLISDTFTKEDIKDILSTALSELSQHLTPLLQQPTIRSQKDKSNMFPPGMPKVNSPTPSTTLQKNDEIQLRYNLHNQYYHAGSPLVAIMPLTFSFMKRRSLKTLDKMQSALKRQHFENIRNQQQQKMFAHMHSIPDTYPSLDSAPHSLFDGNPLLGNNTMQITPSVDSIKNRTPLTPPSRDSNERYLSSSQDETYLGGNRSKVVQKKHFTFTNIGDEQTLSSNTGFKYLGMGMSPGMGITSSPSLTSSTLNDIEAIIRHAEITLSSKMSAEAMITLVVEIIQQFGPLPIGEIGKQLQIKTGNPDISKTLKKQFAGLKKFISNYPSIFQYGDNHNFNPTVYLVGQTSANPTISRVLPSNPHPLHPHHLNIPSTQSMDSSINSITVGSRSTSSKPASWRSELNDSLKESRDEFEFSGFSTINLSASGMGSFGMRKDSFGPFVPTSSSTDVRPPFDQWSNPSSNSR